jgi:hypothetical protein
MAVVIVPIPNISSLPYDIEATQINESEDTDAENERVSNIHSSLVFLLFCGPRIC